MTSHRNEEAFKNVYKKQSVVLLSTRYVIQAIGRICRTNQKNRNIYIYADDSNIAKAAVIEGLCKIGEEKEVSIKMIESQSSYESCFKNGVSSNSWGYWDGSYIFV